MTRILLMVALLGAVGIYALRRGGWPERASAAVLWGMLIIDQLYHLLVTTQPSYESIDPFHAFNDLWALCAMIFIALRADRFWTLWLASLQLIAASAHFLRMIDLEMLRVVYAIIIRFPFWMQIVLIAVGTWIHDRRCKRRAALTI